MHSLYAMFLYITFQQAFLLTKKSEYFLLLQSITNAQYFKLRATVDLVAYFLLFFR